MDEDRTRAERPPGGRRRFGRWCAGVLLTPVTVVLVCRACGVDGVTPVPQLLAFLPWSLVPAALALVLSAGSRWPVGCAWGVLAVVVTGLFLRPYGAGAPPAADPAGTRLRVLTANVEFGGATASLLKLLRSERPDLVSVQECAPAVCGAALDRAEVRAAYPYRRITGGGRAQASAILSRYPLERDGEVPGTLAMPRTVVRIGAARLRFQVAHPMPPVPGGVAVWRRELGRLRTMAAGRGTVPTVIAGDFNASRDHAAFRAVLDTGVRDCAAVLGAARTPTWPARWARVGVQIDHVLVSAALVPRAARFRDLAGSDHRAVVVDTVLLRHAAGGS
ncbi:endonuclease/exonuclease/phosphatase family protein [Streptomyces sp. ISL-11]|uniref:endonuclease/exonuclease/phosphatase family protein n=1 Tax=Streptomyces sp. ISL-11 TaxID=2819174 RepID=UPI001BE9F33B|nr:endonuclease/exonuclease/phosphatase family protein [Streptomyces sp. ISL-11]MBT2385157.1 endonuclease/exonuclease/phosphatase family protein [Streptomyces sp. ISL-11]